MPWRWAFPPWESQEARDAREQALDAVERATLDLTLTKEKVARANRIHDGITRSGKRNHFSEAMEELFERQRAGRGAT
jgi:hypothetical protein